MAAKFEDRLGIEATCISNEFLDQYMLAANGDYVKVYLYIRRHAGEAFQVKEAADALMLTDNDIERAVRYWEKMGVFSKGSVESLEEEIRKEAAFSKSEEVLEQKLSIESELESTEKAERSEEEFAGILYVAKHVLPALPTHKQVEALEYMYQGLEMEAELIEFLLEYCAGLEKTSSRYMETVAINWHEQGIKTVKQAKTLIKEFEQNKLRSRASKNASKAGKGNKFTSNVSKSSVDYDEIAKKKVMAAAWH